MTAKEEFSTTDGSLYRLFIPLNKNLSVCKQNAKHEFIGVIVREVEHGICKQMNEGKDDGVGESEALSAHPREAKARMRY